jgi:hypothetical protein
MKNTTENINKLAEMMIANCKKSIEFYESIDEPELAIKEEGIAKGIGRVLKLINRPSFFETMARIYEVNQAIDAE